MSERADAGHLKDLRKSPGVSSPCWLPTMDMILIITDVFENRTSQERIRTALSQKTTITSVVSHGTILSLVLYNIYTADIPACDIFTEILTYANDTVITGHSKNKSLRVRHIQQ